MTVNYPIETCSQSSCKKQKILLRTVETNLGSLIADAFIYQAQQIGGLSGAPLMTPSTKVLAAFARALKGEFDLIGAGGIASAADAYAKIRAGANAVQLYSAMVYEGPGLAQDINRGLPDLIRADGYATLADAVGTAL